MRCVDCGNISRFEVYRIELMRLVLDFRSARAKRALNAIEHQRAIETGSPIAIRCIKCGAVGSPEDFTFTEEDELFTKPEDREGHNIPEGIPPLDKIKVKVKF